MVLLPWTPQFQRRRRNNAVQAATTRKRRNIAAPQPAKKGGLLEQVGEESIAVGTTVGAAYVQLAKVAWKKKHNLLKEQHKLLKRKQEDRVAACQAVIQQLELENGRGLDDQEEQPMTWNPGAKPRQKRLQQQWRLPQWQPQPRLQPLVLPHRLLLQPPKRETLQPLYQDYPWWVWSLVRGAPPRTIEP
jgi:hypothetical protein